MNLFEKFLDNVNPQTKQVFAQTGQALSQTFKPLTQF